MKEKQQEGERGQDLFIFRVGLNRSRHSRESGNPYHSGLWQLSRGKTIWIPACAGMTRE